MNCRRTRSLLSAYIDRELTGQEMLAIRDHLTYCTECSNDHQSLLSVKRLLTVLPDKAPARELVWNYDQLTARRPIEAVVQVWKPTQLNFWLSSQPNAPMGKRFASALALSLMGVMFLSTPSAQSPGPAQASRPFTNPAMSLIALSRPQRHAMYSSLMRQFGQVGIFNVLPGQSLLQNTAVADRNSFTSWPGGSTLPNSVDSIYSAPQIFSGSTMTFTGYSEGTH